MTDQVPELLYHYTGGAALLGIVESRAIWATKIHYLNDSKEFAHSIEVAGGVIQQLSTAASSDELAILDAIRERIGLASSINVFVSSFSEVRDSLSQWRAYSPSGGGYCLGFVSSALSAVAAPQGFTLRACVYDRVLQEQALSALVSETVASAMKLPPIGRNQCVERLVRKFVELAPTLKDPSFSDEREWRLASAPIMTTEARWRTRAGRSMLIPYVSVDLRMSSGLLPLREVVVGPSPNLGLAMDACLAAVRPSTSLDFGVWRSSVPYRDW